MLRSYNWFFIAVLFGSFIPAQGALVTFTDRNAFDTATAISTSTTCPVSASTSTNSAPPNIPVGPASTPGRRLELRTGRWGGREEFGLRLQNAEPRGGPPLNAPFVDHGKT